MSLIPFWKFESVAGDKFEFRTSHNNKIYLFHTTTEEELVNDSELKGETDDEKIENGLGQIGDFLQNLTDFEVAKDLVLEELEKTRRKMNWI